MHVLRTTDMICTELLLSPLALGFKTQIKPWLSMKISFNHLNRNWSLYLIKIWNINCLYHIFIFYCYLKKIFFKAYMFNSHLDYKQLNRKNFLYLP